MAFRKSRRLRRNLRRKSRRNYRGGGEITNYIIWKRDTNPYATPYTIAYAINENYKGKLLTVNDWRELRNYDNRIYEALATMRHPPENF